MADAADEAQLVARLRSGDGRTRRQAEREVFDRYHASVERVLRRLLGRDLEDCLQEVFVDVFRGLAGFEGRAALSTWVYRVALRRGWKCLAERRRHRARDRDGHDDLPVEQVPARTAPVVEHLEAAELARRFEQALERLDLEQRTVLAMSAAQGLGPPEIAAVLGVPVGTVHSRLHRARERMRELLGLAQGYGAAATSLSP